MLSVSDSAIIILGASGDLAKRKFIPALAKLYEKGAIDSSSLIVETGRTPFNNNSFIARFDISTEFSELLYYHRGIPGLGQFIKKKGSFSRIIFFVALPPSVYAATAEALLKDGFGQESILIIEKPYGHDYKSATKLNTQIKSFFDESQIFRIDYYLAKEAVQNILVFRFANSLFYPLWNSRYIESIQINAFESFGVENRGAYFDKAGIIRDVVQNHLMQLLSLITMEAPVSLEAEDIRVQKINLLKALSFLECYRYQYDGYRDSFDQEIPEAYERLLLDALKGDRTLFISAEETELSWKKIGNFLDRGKLKVYRKGTIPESSFDIEWIDFEKYGSVCQ